MREIFEEYEYNGKKYTIYKAEDNEFDIPWDCSDGRKIYPYEKEALDVIEKGNLIFSNRNDLEEDD